MIIRLEFYFFFVLLIYNGVEALRFGEDNEWDYSSYNGVPPSNIQAPSRHPTLSGNSRFPPTSYTSRTPSFMDSRFGSQSSSLSSPPYPQQDNYPYSAGSNPLASSPAFVQSGTSDRYPTSRYGASNYEVRNSQETPSYSHFSKSSSFSPSAQRATGYNQMTSAQDPEQALTNLLQQFENLKGVTESGDNGYQSYPPPTQEQYNSQPQGLFAPSAQEQLLSLPQQQFAPPSPENSFSPPQEQLMPPPEDHFYSPSPGQFVSPPQEQFSAPPNPAKPLTPGPGGETTIMLSPEQAQILSQVMPELAIRTPDAPITVNSEQLKKLQNVIARTKFQLPPGFPPEFVASIQAESKAPPKKVHKATVVRSRNKVDKDPEEFIRHLSSYKKAHGVDPMLGGEEPGPEGLLGLPLADPADL